jgi:hypothetical protein
MLLTYAQFTLSQAIRSPMQLLNPVVITHDQVSLPRQSVVHMLTIDSEARFPSRSHHLLSGIPKRKKIPIIHITDLTQQNEVLAIANRNAILEINVWKRLNLKDFKEQPFLDAPVTDLQTNNVISYELLKARYRYTSSATSANSRVLNIYKTYWDTVGKAITQMPEYNQVVSLELPFIIPSHSVINNILNQKDTTYARVVTDVKLNALIQLYLYLDPETRHRSAMRDITPEQTYHITVELAHRGHSCFFKLSHLVAMGEGNDLVSKRKLDPVRLQRLFVLLLLDVQTRASVGSNQQAPQATDADKDTQTLDDEDEGGGEPEHVQGPEQPQTEVLTQDPENPEDRLHRVQMPSRNKNKQNNEDFEISEFDSAVTSASIDEKTNETPTYTDDFFTRSIAEAQLTEDTPLDPFLMDYSEDTRSKLLADILPADVYSEYIEQAKTSGSATTADVRGYKKLVQNRAALNSPYGDKPIDQAKLIAPHELIQTPDSTRLAVANNLVDDRLKTERLFTLDKQYLAQVMSKDVLAAVTHLERANIVIKTYEVDTVKAVTGAYEIHKLTLKPLAGKESTVYFRLPVINEEGEFLASGIRYRMRRQRTPLPIAKISPTKVALTTNYGKLFVHRSEKKAYDRHAFIIAKIKKSHLEQDGSITKLIPGNNFSSKLYRPNTYSAMSAEFVQIANKTYSFVFDDRLIQSQLEPALYSLFKASQGPSKGMYPCGYDNAKHVLFMDVANVVHLYNASGEHIPLGTLEELLGLEVDKMPKSFTAIKVLGDSIPLAVMFGYYLGIKGLLSATQTEFTHIGANQRHTPAKGETILRFADVKIIVKTDTIDKQLIFGGFLYYKDFIKQHDFLSFDSKNIYLDMVEHWGCNVIHLKEMDVLRQLFVDPMSAEILTEMGEPHEFLKLVLRANNMLSDFSHPDVNDMAQSRIRGYDRVPGLMYRALSESVREHKFKNTSRSKIELDPYKVWNAITQDTTVKITEETNPIVDIKETESGTFSGADGVSKGATPEVLRRYHASDMGITSEATVDSSDVGLNFYLSPQVRFKNVRGMVDKEAIAKDHQPEDNFSTSALLAPMTEFDDPKRMNFINIQNGHTIACDGYTQPVLRTGYEYLMPYKVGKLYCATAAEEGKVTAVTDKQVTVTYKSGKVQGYNIGSTYGRMEGSIYKHTIQPLVKLGDKLKPQDIVTYNTGFFEKDWLDPTRLIMKFGRNVTVAFTMSDEVYEDASAISAELSKEMSTSYIKEKVFVIEFVKNLIGIREEGTMVGVDDVLFTVVDENSEYSNLTESSIELLKTLANVSPKAKMNGTVWRYEVKYNGDTADMSPTLKKFVTSLDRRLQEETKNTDESVKTNEVTTEYRSQGKNLMPGTLELKVMIETKLTQSLADKGVFGGQMKSVISEVLPSKITTESGVVVDAMFSYRSVLNRVTLSPILAGTTNRLLKHVSKAVAEVYFG